MKPLLYFCFLLALVNVCVGFVAVGFLHMKECIPMFLHSLGTFGLAGVLYSTARDSNERT